MSESSATVPVRTEGPAAAATDPIAIVGIGCRFPGGAADPESFWHALESGADAISEARPDRWSARFFVDPDPASPGRMYARFGGFLAEVDRFDPQFFALAPREAAFMDPQQRLLLEVCWEALEDAGLVAEELSGSKTGVFVGISTHDYGDIQLRDIYSADFYANTGGALSIAANRISYLFNFQGPSVSVDTACSSSLVAIHLACRSIWQGESRQAIAGGVNCILAPETSITFSKGSMLSPDGRCKAFDARANGYVRGEGAGLVVLKPLSRAQRDGDPIYAVILASAVNQDGRTHGMTVPSRAAQETLLRDVYQQADVPPHRVFYMEAHGTGTPVGDPIEANAIGSVLGHGRPADRPLRLGSVKSNIGHLEAASGIAGLIKAALVLKKQRIPASLHFQVPNPKIAFEKLGLRVQQTSEPFPVEDVRAVAGVNSFGFGGTNAHVVMQALPPSPPRRPEEAPAPSGRAYLVPVSGRTPAALVAAARNLAAFLTGTDAGRSARFTDLCYSASVRRSHHDHRAALVATSHEDLASGLQSFIEARESTAAPAPRDSVRTRRLAFVFSGMGPQWHAMGRELFHGEPVFRRAVERCDELFRACAGWSIQDELLAEPAQSRMQQAAVAQPANFVLQIGLAELWASWGVVPEAIVGHSAGEVAAAVVAGALSLADGVLVIFHRSRLQQRAASLGKMLAVGLTAAEAEDAIAPYSPLVSIAAINSPKSVTLSGDSESLEAIARSVAAGDGFSRFLDVDVPYHSHYMDPLEVELLESLLGIDAQTASVPLYSTVSGASADGREFDASYWWSNIRKPVNFAPAIEQLIDEGHDTFVEIGPHPVLAHAIRESLNAREAEGLVLPSLRRERERHTLLESLGSLYVSGHAVRWSALVPDESAFVRLPAYPWQRERCWHESEVSVAHRLADPVHPLLHRRLESPDLAWDTNVAIGMPSYLKDHRVQGSVVYPAAAYIEMALGVAHELGCDLPVLEDIELKRALALSKEAVHQLRFTVDAEQSGFAVHSRPRESGQPWTLHVTGHLRLKRGAPMDQSPALERLRRRCSAELNGEQCYAAMHARGLQYGAQFQGLRTLWQGDGEAIGRVTCPEVVSAGLADYRFHPAVLDACFHVLMGAILLEGTGRADTGTYLPVHIGRLRVHRAPAPDDLWSYARLTSRSATGLTGDLSVFDADGRIVLEITGFRCQHVPEARAADDWSRHIYETRWYAKSLPAQYTYRQAGDLPDPSRIVLSAPQTAALSVRFDRRRHYEEVEPRIEALCGAYALTALTQLGWTPRKGAPVDVASLSAELGVVPQHQRLLGRVLEMLAEDRWLKRAASGWTVARTGMVTSTEATWKALNDAYPEYDAVLALLGGCGPHLADVLRGRQEPLQLVFPDGSMTPAQRLYHESPYNHVYNVLVAQLVTNLLGKLPRDRNIRVLEIGAGTGGTTAHVLPILPAHRTEYVYSDASNVFTTFGKRQFGDYPFVEYQVLDIGRSPEEQGFAPHSFDLVLAADVLHATGDLRATLGHVRQLVASDGLLVLLELIRPSRYLDLIFGLLKDWWRLEDPAVRGGDHPWVSRAGWEGLLREAGFGDVTSLSDVRASGEPFQAVFVARGARVQPAVAHDEPPSEPAAAARWLILADRGGVGQRVAESLEARGAVPVLASAGTARLARGPQHFEVRPDSLEDMTELLALAGPGLQGIVHLWSLDASLPEPGSAAALETAQRLGCISVLNLIQAMAKSGQADPPRLWLATRGAQAIGPEDGPVALAQAPLWGLGRVTANEHPHFRCTLIDLDPAGESRAGDALAQELSADDAEQEIALRGHSRHVTRLVRAPQSAMPVAVRTPVRARKPPFALEATRPGVLDSLALREMKRRKPGPGDVEIEVHAAGLNFRDVMKAMGLYPDEDGNDLWLGDECAGRVVRVGRSVDSLRVGDDVVAISPGTLRSFVTVPATQVRRKPAHFSFEEAATIPIVFLTVIYALKHLAQLSRGERILIHAAAGGVGLAAVQVAQHVGAEIFATAGSPAKREYLKSLGVRHVMDSRTQNFADDVMKITGGKGVAVVLNSLAGEFIPNSLALLEPAGRFVELGKIDIYQDTKLGLAHFKNGRSFFAVDLGWLLQHRPELSSSLMTEMMALFEAGVFRPLPVHTFPVSDAAGAFRHMAQARHIGKLALSVAGQAPNHVLPSAERAPLFSNKATYLVTGGLSGFGLSIGEWIVRQGARHLVLVGRRGMSSDGAEEAVRRLSATGARVHVAAVDVTQADQVTALVDRIAQTMPPLRGIFHAAMVLDDGYLLQLNEARFDRVMAPKVAGTWNLHTATLQQRLDYFVSFSSISSLTGAPGQGNYCAANAFLDAFAHYRRALKLPALTVNWGAIADVGYVARNADIGRYLERQGLEGLKHAEAESILEELLRTGRCQVAALRADFERLAAFAPAPQWSRRLSHFLQQDALDAASSGGARRERGAILKKIRSAAVPQRIEMLQSMLRSALASVLKIAETHIEPHQAFGSLGLDSLMAVELETVVKSELGMDLSMGFLAGGEMTLRQLTERLLDQVTAAQPA